MPAQLTTSKRCRVCSKAKPLDQFHLKSTATGKRISKCTSCVAAYNKRHYRQNAPKYRRLAHEWKSRNPDKVREYNITRYGVSRDEVHRMKIAQHGLCKICGDPVRSGKRLVIDHDHTTGKVRGLLCHQCNIAIGHLSDSPDIALAAARYLQLHQTSGEVP